MGYKHISIQFTVFETLACFKIEYVVNPEKFVKGLEAFCDAYDLNAEIIKFDVHQELDIDALLRNVDVLIMGRRGGITYTTLRILPRNLLSNLI